MPAVHRLAKRWLTEACFHVIGFCC
jgi:hypothetical protein